MEDFPTEQLTGHQLTELAGTHALAPDALVQHTGLHLWLPLWQVL